MRNKDSTSRNSNKTGTDKNEHTATGETNWIKEQNTWSGRVKEENSGHGDRRSENDNKILQYELKTQYLEKERQDQTH